MPEGTRRTVLVLAEHDTTLHDTVARFEAEGFTVHMASGEDDIAAWVRSLSPALVAYRLTDPATKRTVCRSTLKALASLPGARVPTLALCELGEATAAAALCKEGLADDYLIVPHLKDDVDRLTMATERLIALGRQRQKQVRCADAMNALWESFCRFDTEMAEEWSRHDEAGKTAQQLASLRLAHHRTRSRLNGTPVLVIDDDPDLHAVLQALVTAAGQPVASTFNADEAMQWLEINEPALILLDFQMPGQNGVSLLEGIRRLPRLKSVPVIMLTGHSSVETVQRARKLGVSDFIVKPCNPLTILQKISGYL